MAHHDDVVVEGARRVGLGELRRRSGPPRLGRARRCARRAARDAAPAWRPPWTNRWTARPSRGARRTWLAAPSSAKARRRRQRRVDGEAGLRRRRSARSTRAVVGASIARWACASRLAGVKCTRPSAGVGAGRDRGGVGGPHRRRRRAGRRAARGARGPRAPAPRRRRRRSPRRRSVARCGPLVRRQHAPAARPRSSRARILARPSQRGGARVGDLRRCSRATRRCPGDRPA